LKKLLLVKGGGYPAIFCGRGFLTEKIKNQSRKNTLEVKNLRSEGGIGTSTILGYLSLGDE